MNFSPLVKHTMHNVHTQDVCTYKFHKRLIRRDKRQEFVVLVLWAEKRWNLKYEVLYFVFVRFSLFVPEKSGGMEIFMTVPIASAHNPTFQYVKSLFTKKGREQGNEFVIEIGRASCRERV